MHEAFRRSETRKASWARTFTSGGQKLQGGPHRAASVRGIVFMHYMCLFLLLGLFCGTCPSINDLLLSSFFFFSSLPPHGSPMLHGSRFFLYVRECKPVDLTEIASTRSSFFAVTSKTWKVLRPSWGRECAQTGHRIAGRKLTRTT